MITLSEFLNTIPFPESASKSVQVAIREAKRLESLETPRVNADRKPLLYGDGDGLYVVVDSCGHVSDCSYEREEMESFAERVASRTGRPHTVCQVMAPESGECPTIPVVTLTPERPHDWIIYWDSRSGEGSCYGLNGVVWFIDHKHHCVQRFATAAEAQDYIDTKCIKDAYPWPVPKLSEK